MIYHAAVLISRHCPLTFPLERVFGLDVLWVRSDGWGLEGGNYNFKMDEHFSRMDKLTLLFCRIHLMSRKIALEAEVRKKKAKRKKVQRVSTYLAATSRIFQKNPTTIYRKM